MKHDFYEGKYTVLFDEKAGGLCALRYGEDWRDLCGDKLVLSMLQAADRERALLQRAHVLLGEALTQHIYHEENGEHPGPDCPYTQLLRDIESAARDATGEPSAT